MLDTLNINSLICPPLPDKDTQENREQLFLLRKSALDLWEKTYDEKFIIVNGTKYKIVKL